MAKLTDLIVSKVRVKMLELFFQQPSELYYVRQITREINEEINAVRRELTRLTKIGLLKSEQRGNRLYYYLNKQYSFYGELLQLVSKSSGLGKILRQQREGLGNPKFIMFTTRFAQHKKRRIDEIDILFVGDLKTQVLEPLVKAEEKLRNHEINYTIMSLEEFEFRKSRRDPFVAEIIGGGRVMIVGDEDALLERKQEM